MNSYIDKNGKLQYCSTDSTRKCLEFNDTCDKSTGSMACNTPWWAGGYWSGWWGWNPYWDVYGDNLTYLYSEIDGPEWAFCGDYWYGWWWYGGGSQDCGLDNSDCANVTNTNCGRPRLKNCKRYNCVGTNTIQDCTIINGKDREKRCCKAPSNFTCKEGQCDYDYSIVIKEYSVDYERVTGGGSCIDNAGLYEEYPETSCEPSVLITDSICTDNIYGCSPEDPCDSQKCVEAKKFGWEKEGDEPSDIYYWYYYGYGGIVWEYDQIDCGCSTSCGPPAPTNCADCDQYPCNSYGSSVYYPGGWGYWGGYYGGLGSDCCGAPPTLCPKQQGDGSDKPWWCSGTDCFQATQEQGKSYGFDGPYSSYTSCIQKCNVADETNCIQPDHNYTRGLCCDTKFMKEQRKKIEDKQCLDSGPSYAEEKSENLCTDALGCGGGAVYNYSKQMCTFIPKYCKTKKVDRKRGYYTFSYEPEITDKNYECNCIQCPSTGGTTEKDFNDYLQGVANCKKQECYKCPSGSQKPLLKRTKTVVTGGGTVTDTAKVTLKVVYCKITTKQCSPKTPTSPTSPP